MFAAEKEKRSSPRSNTIGHRKPWSVVVVTGCANHHDRGFSSTHDTREVQIVRGERAGQQAEQGVIAVTHVVLDRFLDGVFGWLGAVSLEDGHDKEAVELNLAKQRPGAPHEVRPRPIWMPQLGVERTYCVVVLSNRVVSHAKTTLPSSLPRPVASKNRDQLRDIADEVGDASCGGAVVATVRDCRIMHPAL